MVARQSPQSLRIVTDLRGSCGTSLAEGQIPCVDATWRSGPPVWTDTELRGGDGILLKQVVEKRAVGESLLELPNQREERDWPVVLGTVWVTLLVDWGDSR